MLNNINKLYKLSTHDKIHYVNLDNSYPGYRRVDVSNPGVITGIMSDNNQSSRFNFIGETDGRGVGGGYPLDA